MGLWTKKQLREFIKENKLVTAQDAQNALKDLFAENDSGNAGGRDGHASRLRET